MKLEHKIGEVFTYNGMILLVKEHDGFPCLNCAFDKLDCDNAEIECRAYKREDDRKVNFVLLSTVGTIPFLTEIKNAIEIPNYAFQKIEILPLTKQLSVSILVDSEKSFILHSAKLTPQEVGNDLNEQYERHLSTEPERVKLKLAVPIPFKCPNMEDSCPYVDTMTATLDMNCSECKNNKK